MFAKAVLERKKKHFKVCRISFFADFPFVFKSRECSREFPFDAPNKLMYILNTLGCMQLC